MAKKTFIKKYWWVFLIIILILIIVIILLVYPTLQQTGFDGMSSGSGGIGSSGVLK